MMGYVVHSATGLYWRNSYGWVWGLAKATQVHSKIDAERMLHIAKTNYGGRPESSRSPQILTWNEALVLEAMGS